MSGTAIQQALPDVWVCPDADRYSNNGIVVVSVPVSHYAFQWHCQSALDACEKASRPSDLSVSGMINRGNQVDKYSRSSVVIPFPVLRNICQPV